MTEWYPPPGSDGLLLLKINTAFIAVSTVIVATRLIIRAFVIRNLGIDDLVSTIGLVSRLRDVLDTGLITDIHHKAFLVTFSSMEIQGWDLLCEPVWVVSNRLSRLQWVRNTNGGGPARQAYKVLQCWSASLCFLGSYKTKRQ